MKKLLILLISLCTYLTTSSQHYINKVDNEVVMDINTYRSIRLKYYTCDSLITLKDSIITEKDSLIEKQRDIIRNYNTILLEKDSTIKDLSKEYDLLSTDYQKYVEGTSETKTQKYLQKYIPLLALIIGVFLGNSLK